MITVNDFKFIHDYIVDCEWGKWNIGECSKTCGAGIRENIREEKVFAEFGGKECSGPESVTQTCNIQECPGNTFGLIIINSHVCNHQNDLFHFHFKTFSKLRMGRVESRSLFKDLR